MRATRAIELSTGLFVLFGFAALFFLVTQITQRELSVKNGNSYALEAHFENIGGLKVGAAVSMAGVTVGRVNTIGFDQDLYKAVVKMRINSAFNRIPSDSFASIMTSGLLGSQYIDIDAGGADEYLADGDRIVETQDAFVLEKLIGQFAARFMENRGENPGQEPAQGEESK